MKIKGTDLKEVMKYIQEKTHQGDIELEITLEGRLEIKTNDKLENPVKITIYEYTSEYAPRLTKTGRLGDDL